MKPRESHDHSTRSKSFYKEPLHLSGIVVPIRTRSKTLVIERIIQQHAPTKNQTPTEITSRKELVRRKRRKMTYNLGCPSLGGFILGTAIRAAGRRCCWHLRLPGSLVNHGVQDLVSKSTIVQTRCRHTHLGGSKEHKQQVYKSSSLEVLHQDQVCQVSLGSLEVQKFCNKFKFCQVI